MLSDSTTEIVPRWTIFSLQAPVLQNIASYLPSGAIFSLRLSSRQLNHCLLEQLNDGRTVNEMLLKLQYAHARLKLAQTLAWQQMAANIGARKDFAMRMSENAERIEYLLDLFAVSWLERHEGLPHEGNMSFAEKERFRQAMYRLWSFCSLGPVESDWGHLWAAEILDLAPVIAVASWFQNHFDEWPAGAPAKYRTAEECKTDLPPPGISYVINKVVFKCLVRARDKGNGSGEASGLIRDIVNKAMIEGVNDDFKETWKTLVMEL